MPINLDEALGAELPPAEFSWTSSDIQLYHLGLGAGQDPMDERELRRVLREGDGEDRIHMNCSGKHAGMLAACAAAGWPTGSYLDPDHPLQQEIRRTVEDLSGEPPGATGVDLPDVQISETRLNGLRRRGSIGLILLSFLILLIRGPDPMRRFMILIMPLLVLLSVVVMLSEFRAITLMLRIALHLLTLFVVSMVCHGELARDRPAPAHLTEYFLWMSIGGVVGGLFNGLIAPLVFNGIIEYHLMMVVACLLLHLNTEWGRLSSLQHIGHASRPIRAGPVVHEAAAQRLLRVERPFGPRSDVPQT